MKRGNRQTPRICLLCDDAAEEPALVMVDGKDKLGGTGQSLPQEITYHYIKSNFFRVIHADGVIGGVTPAGNVHLAFYSERPAIPQMMKAAVTPEGKLGETIGSSGKAGIAREMDVDVQLSRQAVIQLRDWLSERIVEIEKASEMAQELGAEK